MKLGLLKALVLTVTCSMGMPAAWASAMGSDECDKRICVSLNQSLGNVYLTVVDQDDARLSPVVAPLTGINTIRGRNEKSSQQCNLDADPPASGGGPSNHGTVTTTATTCSYNTGNGTYTIITVTFVWQWNANTGVWTLKAVETSSKTVKITFEEK